MEARTVPADPKVRVLRGWRRQRTLVAVRITWDGGSVQGLIRDISRHGAGLSLHGHSLSNTAGSAVAGFADNIIIEGPGFAPIAGRVRWRAGHRFGVAFSDKLAADHALLASLPATAAGAGPRAASAAAAGSALVIGERAAAHARSDRAIPVMRGFREILAILKGMTLTAWHALEVWRERRTERRRETMIERACRRQGHAWLVGDAVADAGSEAQSEAQKRNRI